MKLLENLSMLNGGLSDVEFSLVMISCLESRLFFPFQIMLAVYIVIYIWLFKLSYGRGYIHGVLIDGERDYCGSLRLFV